MSKIEKIQKEKKLTYTGDKLEYFINENNSSNLISYENIITKIRNAKSLVNIASTSNVNPNIIDALIQNSDINVYIILKSFDGSNDTLNRFDKRKPASIREIDEVENNFIIIDNISYIFINQLSAKENINISLCEDKTKDLKYLFHHYFWDCASKEKLVDSICDVYESPYPPIGKRELEHINIAKDNINFDTLYIPRKKEYVSRLNKSLKNGYFCTDLKSEVYKKDELLKIGNFVFEVNDFSLNNIWKLHENNLVKIDCDLEIIPKNNIENKPLKIQNEKEITLDKIVSNTIEEMKDTKPKNFKKENYIKTIIFKWNVEPPLKSKDSKRSTLYTEYEKLNKEYQEQLVILEKKLNQLIKESSILDSFLRLNKKAEKSLERLNEYRIKSLEKLSSEQLDKHLNEFESFKSSIEVFTKDFKEDKKKEDQKEKWEKEKLQKKNNLEEKEKQLEEKKIELSRLEKDTKEYKIVLNQIKQSKKHIEELNKELTNKYSHFKYNPNLNSVKNFNKNLHNGLKKLIKPKYILPEVGELFETKNSYYLEIENYLELEKANSLKQRYSEKYFKVVAKLSE